MGRPRSTLSLPVVTVEGASVRRRTEPVVAEEPMEVRVAVPGPAGEAVHPVAVTMRTPGHDFDLALGFLFGEGVVCRREEVARVSYCTDPGLPQEYNTVKVTLAPGVAFDPLRLSRHTLTSSACGVCGSVALEQALRDVPPLPPEIGPRLTPADLLRLAEALDAVQPLFRRTGGLHASALFDGTGRPLLCREDVGRHNAMDKVVGALLREGGIPAHETLVLVSGRAGFELVQKAVRAGIPFMVAIGAPTSLAVELAQAAGLTLVGFLRGNRFHIYAGEHRVRCPSP